MSGFASLMAPVGPMAEAFVNDRRFLTGIMGPVGSAKTTSCIRKIVNSALWQGPGNDGIYRARWAAIRNTYNQLERNVLNSWFKWFKKTKSNWNGKEYCQRLHLNVIDATSGEKLQIYIEIYFIALNERSVEEVVRGLELTGLWLNEADKNHPDCWYLGSTRVGRYPLGHEGECRWSGVICDFNAPDIDNWTYELFVDSNLGLDAEVEAELRVALGARFGVGFYRQPGGRSKDPLPENIQNLPPGYYSQQIMALGKRPNLLRRMVDNEFGVTMDGQPVYPEYNPGLHYKAERLAPLPDYPIFCGVDGGRTPAGVFFQVPGYLRIMSELVLYDPKKVSSGDNIYLDRLGPSYFGELMRAHAMDMFGDREIDTVFYDPSIDFGQEEEAYDWLAVLKSEFPCRYKPGGDAANRVDPRLEATRYWFNHSPGGQPGLLIGSDCPVLRRALAGGYTLQQRKTSTGMVLAPKPDKGPFSHVANALEHGTLGHKLRGKGLERQYARRDSRQSAGPRVEYSKGYFSPLRQGGR